MKRLACLYLLVIVSCGSRDEVERVAYDGPQPPDGCSGGTDHARRWFKNACYNHDVCYRIGDNRNGCDLQFRRDMFMICNGAPLCRAEAQTMFLAVALNPRGDLVFARRHKKEQEWKAR